MSYGGRLSELAGSDPDRVVARHVDPDGSPDHTFTLAELITTAEACATEFASRGVGLDDRVAISLQNSPELLVSVFAAWKLGATPVPVRWDLPDWERSRVLAAVSPALHVADGTAVSLAPQPFDTRSAPHRTALASEPVGAAAWGICSGGSTGTPKVIVADRPSRWAEAYGSCIMGHWREVARPQRVLVLAPMYHSTAFTSTLNLLAGDEIVVLRRFDAATALDTIERLDITNFVATPTMLARMADAQQRTPRDLSSLDWVLQGAAPMPPSLTRRWIDLVGAQRFVMAYGMSEGLGLTAIRGDEWLEHPGSVGRGIRGTEVRVLDAERRPVEPGVVGEIYLRTPGGSAQYLGDTPALPTTADGFSSAGDLGHLDADGYLHLADRRTDLIVTGGANVYPAEVESALIEHPAIADVVVVGLSDAQWGRRVHAIIEAAEGVEAPGSDDVVAFARSRLAAYKVPKTVEIVAAIPRSAATKVNRRALVEARGG